MKAIFISQAVLNKNNGGGQFVRSLIVLLSKIVGEDNLQVVSLPSQFDPEITPKEAKSFIIYKDHPNRIQKIKNVLAGCPTWISKEICDEVMKVIVKGNYDFAFLGFSTYKYLIKRIKEETDLPVFVMYQGVTPNTKLSKLQNAGFIKKLITLPSLLTVIDREKTNAVLSNCNIIHNKRDRDAFYKYYKMEPDMYLPVFISDKYSEDKGENPGYTGLSLLFIGSYFGPNLSGLKWFVDNVMSKLPNEVNLYVVGQGMEIIRNEERYQKDNIHIIGEVEKLDSWYYHADIVVEPIFEGDGMKTKTVEAMMYGKLILGTDEAFCGYEGMDEYLCNTAGDFITRINSYIDKKPEKYIESVRRVYLEKYSDTAVLDSIKRKVEELCLESVEEQRS